MAVVWAARSPMTVTQVWRRVVYPHPLIRESVASALLRLHRRGLVARTRPDARSFVYEPTQPLAEHLGAVIAGLLAISPDRPVTLRAALGPRPQPPDEAITAGPAGEHPAG
jgi:predicted transcriptional regulator